jgi:SAM-dependent methyltransferase
MPYPAAVRRAGRLGRRLLAATQLPPPTATAPPWLPPPDLHGLTGVYCNICRRRGEDFCEPGHVEFAICPGCGSNGRDRFLHWCLAERVPLRSDLRVIECSPRLGVEYRQGMATWFRYQCCDYDGRSHVGTLEIDLQAIDLPDASLDLVLCAHVLEHVPDTYSAIAEIHRVLAPGGHLLLQVPVLQARTAPPREPEFHGDDTPVFWRFGFDLTDRLRQAGFDTELLCTAELAQAARTAGNPWPTWALPFDVPDMLAGIVPDDLVPVADPAQAARLGLEPAYQFLTWNCTRP